MKTVLKWLGLSVVVLAAVVLVLRLGWFDAAIISGRDMLPGLNPDSFVVVNRRAEPKRGDLVMYRAKSNHYVIRRVIALPGERVRTQDGIPVVDDRQATQEELRRLVEGGRTYRVVKESLGGRSYEVADDVRRTISDMKEQVLSSDGYFVLADNREHARDSREEGPVPRSRIRGVVVW